MYRYRIVQIAVLITFAIGLLFLPSAVKGEGATKNTLNSASLQVYAQGFDNTVFIEHIIATDVPNAVVLVASDLNDDGYLDVISGNRNAPTLSWWENDGHQSFTEHVFSNFQVYAVDVGDVNNDGKNDIIAGIGGDCRRYNWYQNNGNGTFTEHYLTYSGYGEDPIRVQFIDMNNDDNPDIVLAANHSYHGTITWLESQGGAVFVRHDITGSFAEIANFNVADINGDGNLDIVAISSCVVSACPAAFSWFENDGNGVFIEHILPNSFITGQSVYPEDFDGNGTIDLLVDSMDDGTQLWKNDGDENFTPGQQISPPGTWSSLFVNDIDGDSDFDFTQPNFLGNKISLWENSGNGTFTEHIISSNFYRPMRVISADVNRDDNQDILAVSMFSGRLAWFEYVPQLSISAGGPYVVDEGSSVTATASNSGSSSDHLSYAWDLDNSGTFESPGKSALFSAVTSDGPEMKTISVQVTNSYSQTATASTTVTVNNVPPSVGAIAAPVDPTSINTAVNANVSFTDPGELDTHTAVWDWGDNSTSAGTVNETNGSVTGSHTYTPAGVYTVKVTVTDDDGGSDESIFQYVVIYDPNSGFVTGGGWINSPEGAYTPDPSLTGKATFGFVSKYQKGANVPTGNTEFQFHVANLNFKSTSYDWLVIAGTKAQYKGTGTINDSGNYGFMLTTIDGQINGGGGVDKFRIKIWDKATGEVIYDNQLGASDDVLPTTAIQGGSIVIHKAK